MPVEKERRRYRCIGELPIKPHHNIATIECPFCFVQTEVTVWALSSGKECECGAVHNYKGESQRTLAVDL